MHHLAHMYLSSLTLGLAHVVRARVLRVLLIYTDSDAEPSDSFQVFVSYYTCARIATMGVLPHILFLLVDDFGWANTGWHRLEHPTAEVSTPNMDALVKNGLELDRHYVYKYCCPLLLKPLFTALIRQTLKVQFLQQNI